MLSNKEQPEIARIGRDRVHLLLEPLVCDTQHEPVLRYVLAAIRVQTIVYANLGNTISFIPLPANFASLFRNLALFIEL